MGYLDHLDSRERVEAKDSLDNQARLVHWVTKVKAVTKDQWVLLDSRHQASKEIKGIQGCLASRG